MKYEISIFILQHERLQPSTFNLHPLPFTLYPSTFPSLLAPHLGTCQILMVLSALALTRVLPSGLNATAQTEAE